MNENKFIKATKSSLAQRAGYMCSLCGKLTVGPSSETKSSVALLGDAAHIASVEPGGRRYEKGMTSKERKDISNGIWLCKDHHKLIDSDECRYTKGFLETIKKNHEKRISILNSGVNLENGLVVNIQIENIGKIVNKCNIEFSNSTLFFGNNGTGKTLICDIISSLHYPDKITKWVGRRNQGSSNYTVSYYDTKLSTYRINYSSKKVISFSYDENVVPTILSPYYCLYIEKDFFDVTRDIENITLQLATYFRLKENEIVELINFINKLEKVFVNDIYFENHELIVKMNAKSPTLNFESLSTGEQYRVILELGLRLANYYSMFKPTILLIENSAIDVLDNTGVNVLLNWIRDKKVNYQFVFTTYRDHSDFNIEGHKSYLLVEDNNNVDVKIINNG